MWRRWSGLVNASRSRPLPFHCDTKGPLTIPFDHFVFGTRLKSGGKKKVDLSHLIPENELHEDFVFGSGPGGQAVNKTKNAVFLKHIPTGVFVKCHETRSCEINRELARKYLAEKVDLHLHGEDSQLRIKQRELSEQKLRKKADNKRLLEMKNAYKDILANQRDSQSKDS